MATFNISIRLLISGISCSVAIHIIYGRFAWIFLRLFDVRFESALSIDTSGINVQLSLVTTLSVLVKACKLVAWSRDVEAAGTRIWSVMHTLMIRFLWNTFNRVSTLPRNSQSRSLLFPLPDNLRWFLINPWMELNSIKFMLRLPYSFFCKFLFFLFTVHDQHIFCTIASTILTGVSWVYFRMKCHFSYFLLCLIWSSFLQIHFLFLLCSYSFLVEAFTNIIACNRLIVLTLLMHWGFPRICETIHCINFLSLMMIFSTLRPFTMLFS